MHAIQIRYGLLSNVKLFVEKVVLLICNVVDQLM